MAQSDDTGQPRELRLGVNIDHVATLRNARGEAHPSPIGAAALAAEAGADGITAHLREDRRHIRDEDMRRLAREIDLPLNMEMAATNEMQRIVLKLRPHACCLVPERRQELTTEGGLDVAGSVDSLALYVPPLKDRGIRVSLFIDPDPAQVEAARATGADAVELHTGRYVNARGEVQMHELERLRAAASQADRLGLEVHAGHGLNYDTVEAVAAIPEIVELNIGHFLIGQALFVGLEAAIRRMRRLMNAGRFGE